MPAVNPRITITLSPEVHATLRRLSQLTGNSQSALVGELLETSKPVFDRMTKVLEAAERLKAEGLSASSQIRESLEVAQYRLEDQLDLVMERVEDQLSPLLSEAQFVPTRSAVSGRMRAPRAPAGDGAEHGSTPVPVTRGSGTPKKRKAEGKEGTGRGVGRGSI